MNKLIKLLKKKDKNLQQDPTTLEEESFYRDSNISILQPSSTPRAHEKLNSYAGSTFGEIMLPDQSCSPKNQIEGSELKAAYLLGSDSYSSSDSDSSKSDSDTGITPSDWQKYHTAHESSDVQALSQLIDSNESNIVPVGINFGLKTTTSRQDINSALILRSQQTSQTTQHRRSQSGKSWNTLKTKSKDHQRILNSTLSEHSQEQIESKIGHCAINQLIHLVYKKQAHAIKTYLLKMNEQCENAINDYLELCVQIAETFVGQTQEQAIEHLVNRFRLDQDSLGLIAIFQLLTALIEPLIPSQKNIITCVKQDFEFHWTNGRDKFIKLDNSLKIAFKQENYIESLIHECRVVTLDRTTSHQVKSYSLLWLAQYGKVNNKMIRYFFENDLKYFLDHFQRICRTLTASDLIDVRDQIAVLIGRQTVQEHFPSAETIIVEMGIQSGMPSFQSAQRRVISLQSRYAELEQLNEDMHDPSSESEGYPSSNVNHFGIQITQRKTRPSHGNYTKAPLVQIHKSLRKEKTQPFMSSEGTHHKRQTHTTTKHFKRGRRNSEESQNLLTTESHKIFTEIISPQKKPVVGSPDLTSSRKRLHFNLISPQEGEEEGMDNFDVSSFNENFQAKQGNLDLETRLLQTSERRQLLRQRLMLGKSQDFQSSPRKQMGDKKHAIPQQQTQITEEMTPQATSLESQRQHLLSVQKTATETGFQEQYDTRASESHTTADNKGQSMFLNSQDIRQPGKSGSWSQFPQSIQIPSQGNKASFLSDNDYCHRASTILETRQTIQSHKKYKLHNEPQSSCCFGLFRRDKKQTK